MEGAIKLHPDDEISSDEEEGPVREPLISIKQYKTASCTIVFLLLTAFLGTLGVFIVFLPDENMIRLDEDRQVLPKLEIMLFGDSLVGVSDQLYHLDDELKADIEKKHSHYDVIISSSAVNGNKADDLLQRVDRDVLSRSVYRGNSPAPDAVIVLFDSDAADVDEGSNSKSIRAAYRNDVSSLLHKLTAKVAYVAFAGPILMGELPEGKNGKDSQMDAYEAINKEVAAEHNVPYIALREIFEANEPKKGKSMNAEEGKLTMDGEHPLKKGAELIEDALLTQLLSWDDLWIPSVKANLFEHLRSSNTLWENHGDYYAKKKAYRDAVAAGEEPPEIVHGAYYEEKKNEKES